MCSKDCKKFGAAAGAAVVLLIGLEAVVHHVLLGPTYARPEFATVWNPPAEMSRRTPVMFLAYILFGVMFAKIYTKGYEEERAPLGQGIRYGLSIGLLAGVTHALLNYTVYPVSAGLASAWAVSMLVNCVIMGVAVAYLYRPKPETPHTHEEKQ